MSQQQDDSQPMSPSSVDAYEACAAFAHVLDESGLPDFEASLLYVVGKGQTLTGHPPSRPYVELRKLLPLNVQYETHERVGLNVQYAELFPSDVSNGIMSRLEKEVRYSSPEDCRIKVFGRWFNIPRRQVAYGDTGLTYIYSGRKVQVLEWSPFMKELLEVVNTVTGHDYNFALINRYKDGCDKIGFHADDEASIDLSVPIASLSFGAARDFVFRHKVNKRNQLKITLKPGTILLMNSPTNLHWHHSLPACKKCTDPRVNMTFRKIKNV